MKQVNDITGSIIDAAIKIHTDIGPGLLESVYERLLAQELEARGFFVEQQKSVSFEYNDMDFPLSFRVDLLIERRVVVELKSVETLAPVHYKQLLSYLRLMQLEVGLLLNFGQATLVEGLHRVVNHYHPKSAATDSKS